MAAGKNPVVESRRTDTTNLATAIAERGEKRPQGPADIIIACKHQDATV